MHKHQEQEIGQLDHSKLKGILKTGTIFVVVISIFIIAFLGVFFPNKSELVIEIEKNYFKVDDQRIEFDKQLKHSLIQYHNKLITEENLLSDLKTQIPLIISLTKSSEVLKKEYEEALENEKLFGFRNVKVFFSHLGMPVVALALGVLLLFLFFKEKNFFFRKVILSFSLVGLIVGLFYLIWVFYPSPDVPQWAYIVLLFLFSIVGTTIAYIITRYMYKLSKIDLVFKMNNLLHYINFDIKRKYIRKQDRKEYLVDFLSEIDKIYEEK